MLGFYSNQLKDLDIKAITSEHETALTEAFYHAKESLDAEELCDWFISVSNPFYRAAFWQLITPLYEEILQILEVSVNPENLLFGVTLNYLGILYTNMGEYEKALPLYQRALDIREKVLGPQHPDVATTLNNLAGLYESMGEYEKALPLYQRALEIVEKKLGMKHPNTVTIKNNYNFLLSKMSEE